MSSEEKFMKVAIEQAKLALKDGDWPIGCVIELGGEIIAKARNQVYSRRDKMAHAEMIALQTVSDILRDNQDKATLYTTYEPCPMCFGAIVLNRIKRVVAGIDLDDSGSMYFRDNLPKLFKQEKFKVDFVRGVCAQECRDVFIKGEPTKKLIKSGLIRTDVSQV